MVTVFSANNRNNIPSESFTPLPWHCFHPCLQLVPFLHSYLRFVSIKKWGSDRGCGAEKFGKKNEKLKLRLVSPHWQPHKNPHTHTQHVSISDVSVSDVWGTGQSEVHSLPTPPGPSLGKIPSCYRCLPCAQTSHTQHTNPADTPSSALNWRCQRNPSSISNITVKWSKRQIGGDGDKSPIFIDTCIWCF